MPPVRSSLALARKRPRHLDQDSDDSEVSHELALTVQSDPTLPTSHTVPTSALRENSEQSIQFHCELVQHTESTSRGEQCNSSTWHSRHVMSDPSAAESSRPRLTNLLNSNDSGTGKSSISAGRKRIRKISDSSTEGGYVADRLGLTEDVTLRYSRKAIDPHKSISRDIHPTDGEISRSKTRTKTSSVDVTPAEALHNKRTKTESRLQGLEIILRRYGGDAPSRPLTTTKSTPLPISQRLRLTASAARRPIEEDNPFNPARVSRRGLPGSTLTTREDDRRSPSNPIQRTLTGNIDGFGERQGPSSERRSAQVRPRISASQSLVPLYRTTSMWSTSRVSSQNASTSVSIFTTPLSRRSGSDSRRGQAPARRRSRTNSMIQVPGLVRTNSQIGILQRMGSIPIASRERIRNALGDVSRHHSQNSTFNAQARAGAFLTGEPSRTTGSVDEGMLGRTRSLGGGIDKLNQTEEDKLAADLQAMALARKFHTPSPFEIADPRSVERICHHQEEMQAGDSLVIQSSPYFTVPSRDYNLNLNSTVPGPRSPTSPSAPYSQSSPRSDRFRLDHRSASETKKRYIMQPRVSTSKSKNAARPIKTEVIGVGGASNNMTTNRRHRPGLTRQKAMLDLKPLSRGGCMGSKDRSIILSEEDVMMLGT